MESPLLAATLLTRRPPIHVLMRLAAPALLWRPILARAQLLFPFRQALLVGWRRLPPVRHSIQQIIDFVDSFALVGKLVIFRQRVDDFVNQYVMMRAPRLLSRLRLPTGGVGAQAANYCRILAALISLQLEDFDQRFQCRGHGS